jgi:hypothetical protein
MNPDVPYMSDEALYALGEGKEYTQRRFLELATALQDKAKKLAAGGVLLPACVLTKHMPGLVSELLRLQARRCMPETWRGRCGLKALRAGWRERRKAQSGSAEHAPLGCNKTH